MSDADRRVFICWRRSCDGFYAWKLTWVVPALAGAELDETPVFMEESGDKYGLTEHIQQ